VLSVNVHFCCVGGLIISDYVFSEIIRCGQELEMPLEQL
jgi:hypothetical protein